MIISFKCKDTEKLASGVRVRRFVNFERIALRKIRQLQAANCLDDLKIPQGNKLEALSDDRSITADTDLRLCRFFGFSNGYWLRVQAAYDTEVAEAVLADQLKNIRPWSETNAQSGHRA